MSTGETTPEAEAAPGESYAWRDGRRVPLSEAFPPDKPGEPAAKAPEPAPAPAPEPPKPDRLMTSLEKATAELRRFPQLLPGAVERLAPRWAMKLGSLPPDQRAARAVELMDGPTEKQLTDSEYLAPKLPNGADPSPVRATLARYADRIAPGQLDALTARLSVELSGRKPPLIASAVVRFLASPEAKPYLVAPAGPAPSAARAPEPKPVEPARQPDGRFATPPSKPNRPRSTF
jgi:hypothetical protein